MKNSDNDEDDLKKERNVNKTKITLLRIIFMVLVVCIFALFGASLGIFMGIIESAPDIAGLELKPSTNYTSFIYDVNGNEIDRLSSGQERIYVTLDQIPDHLQKAIISIEDERFMEHNGIDIRGILRAIIVNLTTNQTEGASTITQQLIKNNILSPEQTITRKIQEQYLALQFEKIYDKDLILEYYLNTMALGHGTNGVQAASHRYFNKDVSELSLAESVVLAGITQAPTRYSPITNPENNNEKAKIILQKMIEQGYITEEERQVALAENPYDNIQTVNQQYVEESPHTYFVDAVIEDVLVDLQEKNAMTENEAKNYLFGGGVEIYTTFDPEIQNIVDTHMADDSLFPVNENEIKLDYRVSLHKPDGTVQHYNAVEMVKSVEEIDKFKEAKLVEWGATPEDTVDELLLQIPQPQAAFVIMDQSTGQVKALSGGRGDKIGDRTFNRATQAKRQPGSTFKIVAAYGPAIDMGILSPGSAIDNSKLSIEIPGQPDYSPRNWDGNYGGTITTRKAIWNSTNVPAVRTIQSVGFDASFNYLMNFGFTTLLPTDKVYALPLGGLTEGVTPLELTAAYAAIANGGTYIEPTLYTKILDRDGAVLIENIPTTHQVISASTATMLTDMMEDVVTGYGTGASLSRWFSGQPVAGKTGTTSDEKDLSFAGFTPYYTATVWLGHDDPQSLSGSNQNEHLHLWGEIMSDIHSGLEYKNFDKVTTGFVEASVCSVSGMLPTSLCRGAGAVTTDYFRTNHISDQYCTVHGQTKICTVSDMVAGPFCPPNVVTNKITQGASYGAVCNVHTQPPLPQTESIIPQLIPDSWFNEWPEPMVSEPEPEPQPEPQVAPEFVPPPVEFIPIPEINPNITIEIEEVPPPPEPGGIILEEQEPTADDQSIFFVPQG
ncbi:hypothetical protein AN644_04400 [Candidatus Epulonipiscium fishelsonii]|nr:hypothetical protein AN644_04400 [Epulopiscium sp. SCG-C06WGA-EpuloA1]